jgi:hypothetical protein
MCSMRCIHTVGKTCIDAKAVDRIFIAFLVTLHTGGEDKERCGTGVVCSPWDVFSGDDYKSRHTSTGLRCGLGLDRAGDGTKSK